MKSSVSQTHILKVQEGNWSESPDLLSVEEPLEIRLASGKGEERSKKSISITMRTPGHDFELALGFLYSEGIISGMEAVEQIRYCSEPETPEAIDNIVIVDLKPDVAVDLQKLQRNFYTTSSCGVCGKASIEALQHQQCRLVSRESQLVKAAVFNELPQKLRQKQSVFEYTGGIHACALFDFEGELQLLREDVGRHNALDKLIGACLAENKIDTIPQKSVLLLSGRISFELVQKAAMAGVPVIAAVGAPSSLAVATAQQTGICLVGFLRNNRFNIYSNKEKIIMN
ncbi:formate dehydrogenase accessory sulfurtransferase FdhD [bacterium]|nr:formate dehydrogenase accessory sulfurtransferase FdhD [bacterium]